MPLSIDSLAITPADDNCRLTYQLTSKIDETLTNVKITFEIYDPTTLKNRGLRPEASLELAPSSRIIRAHEFRCMRDGERAVLVVWEAESMRSVWKTDEGKLMLAIGRCLGGKRYTLPKVSWWVAVDKQK